VILAHNGRNADSEKGDISGSVIGCHPSLVGGVFGPAFPRGENLARLHQPPHAHGLVNLKAGQVSQGEASWQMRRTVHSHVSNTTVSITI
jgi:hypothetical protein